MLTKKETRKNIKVLQFSSTSFFILKSLYDSSLLMLQDASFSKFEYKLNYSIMLQLTLKKLVWLHILKIYC